MCSWNTKIYQGCWYLTVCVCHGIKRQQVKYLEALRSQLITSAEEVKSSILHVCCLFVISEDASKTCYQISITFGGRFGHQPRSKWLVFSADPDPNVEVDQRFKKKTKKTNTHRHKVSQDGIHNYCKKLALVLHDFNHLWIDALN